MQLSKISRLHDRATLLGQSRQFFAARQILEVDCPCLSLRASIDAHIDLIPALYHQQETCYLHSSPEYGMKRLLAEGIGDCYQLSHVFRDGELSSKHNPEFMLAEWYRLGFDLEQMIEETVAFIRLFLGNLSYQTISYRDLFLKYTGIDYCLATNQELFAYIQAHQIPFYTSILEEGRDALLNLILGAQIESQLGQQELCVLAYYPATQAALACRRKHGAEEVAERFEIYYKGVELANGYHELTDAKEQEQRFLASNKQRIDLGKKSLPLDFLFLEALKKLPDCCGVAVGFDRLMMLRHQSTTISDVIAWGWVEA
ncbi:EF-P lysine aminoacylase EpmA [Candidatus Protochlamydia sp. R18]|uniref:EF-P lysine aminoacylase EpmA n=1 Tax=Candidatus Protochlamydia sp. R18 TaxID=1353977 RepID=UPI000AF04778|nr:EF-P lysine aminoacylase EpmA [Candidatus Protochlamydia sp. R18]